MSSKILFSVVIPTCDREDFLIVALDSASLNLPSCGEIIVVNDGAPLSNKVLKYLHEKSIKLIEVASYAGASFSRNQGVKFARGEWVLFLDDDDLVAPGYWLSLSAMIQKALNPGELAWGFCAGRTFNSRDSVDQLVSVASDFVYERINSRPLKSKIAGLGMGFWISKKLFENVGGLDERLKVNEDTDICIRLAQSKATCFKTENVGVFVYHGIRPKGVRGSVTKSFGSDKRLNFFQIIFEKNRSAIQGCADTEKWIWRRYLKFAGRIRCFKSMFFFIKNCKLKIHYKSSLLLYFLINYLFSRNSVT